MNTNSKSYGTEENAEDAAKIKTLDFSLAVSDRNLEQQVKRVFDLAKSAGQELDVTFSVGTI